MSIRQAGLSWKGPLSVNAPPIWRVAVVGAASQIGKALLPRLAAKGMVASRVGRAAAGEPADGVTHVFDIQRGCFQPELASAEALISLAPLPTIDVVLHMARALGARRVIAFGSTGRFSKLDSTSGLERDFAVQQQEAERLLASSCEVAGIAWTLFRPTMIYGADADLTVAFIKATIRKFGFFPVPWAARGLRQPVHVDDLAHACVAVLECAPSFNRAYNLGGADVLMFPELVKRIFEAEGKRPLLLPVPRWLYGALLTVVAKLPAYAFVRREMMDRMYQNLTTDNTPARRDFGYSPRSFDPCGKSGVETLQ